MTSLLLPHLSSSILNLLCHSKTDAWFLQDAPKAVWSIPYVSVAFFPSLKHNFIAYRSSKVTSRPDCIFEIHQLWQSGFSRVYSNYYCSSWFEPEIIKIGQPSHKMYSNNILNLQESTTIWNVCTKQSGNLLNAPCILIKNEEGKITAVVTLSLTELDSRENGRVSYHWSQETTDMAKSFFQLVEKNWTDFLAEKRLTLEMKRHIVCI